MACVRARSSRGLTCTSSDASIRSSCVRNQVLVAARHDDDRVRRHTAIVRTSGLEAEAALQVDELDGVAVGVYPPDVEPGRGRAVGREQLPETRLEGIAASHDGPHVDGPVERVERLGGCRADRPALLPRPVPAGKVARREHVDDDREHDRGGDLSELQRPRAGMGAGSLGIRRAARRGAAHPHLRRVDGTGGHEKSGSAIIVP